MDGLIRLRRDQVPLGIADVSMDRGGIAEQIARLPLTGIATNEAVEIFEAHTDRPLVEWSGLAGYKRRYVVDFAKPRGAVAVVQRDFANGRSPNIHSQEDCERN